MTILFFNRCLLPRIPFTDTPMLARLCTRGCVHTTCFLSQFESDPLVTYISAGVINTNINLARISMPCSYRLGWMFLPSALRKSPAHEGSPQFCVKLTQCLKCPRNKGFRWYRLLCSEPGRDPRCNLTVARGEECLPMKIADLAMCGLAARRLRLEDNS